MIKSKNKNIHIVSFDIPYPPNYGGIIDIYYKVKTLNELGINVILHCFQYGKKLQSEKLNKICKKVFYYERDKSIKNLFSFYPYISNTRKSKILFNRINLKTEPIIFEGIHTCYNLNKVYTSKKNIYIRAHNVEHKYYWNLFKNERNIFHKIYFLFEYIKIKKFEKKLSLNYQMIAISKNDQIYFNKFGSSKLIYPFHSNNSVDVKLGKGNYAIYHGNLSISENENSILFLIKKVFKHLNYPLIITGLNPSKKLIKVISKNRNIQLKPNPNDNELSYLLLNAQIHLLHSSQMSGFKLKLIKSLYTGRYCILNKNMLFTSDLSEIFHVAENAKEWINLIKNLSSKSIQNEDLSYRRIFVKRFNNKILGEKLIKLVFQ